MRCVRFVRDVPKQNDLKGFGFTFDLLSSFSFQSNSRLKPFGSGTRATILFVPHDAQPDLVQLADSHLVFERWRQTTADFHRILGSGSDFRN
jgi:hypothetical protein